VARNGVLGRVGDEFGEGGLVFVRRGVDGEVFGAGI
jgi:hypothetical protein